MRSAPCRLAPVKFACDQYGAPGVIRFIAVSPDAKSACAPADARRNQKIEALVLTMPNNAEAIRVLLNGRP